MFDPGETRLFGLPPGVDFAEELIAGLRARVADAPPGTIGRVRLYVNTRRMARRLRSIFEAGPPGLLPRVGLITDLARDPAITHIPPAVPPLRRRLQLTQLVSVLLDREPELAPRTALFDLADSLAALLDEMHGEGVSPEDIAGLDVRESSGHWRRSQKFLNLVSEFIDNADEPPDTEQRQRLVVNALNDLWAATPPQDPVIVAGSTGSRGTTAKFLRAVMDLPQGAVILPGVDFDQPREVWDAMHDALTSEDHPQYRFLKLAASSNLHPADIPRWTATSPINAPRNALMSLALRPAPVTDQWMRDGPKLTDLATATQDMTLLQAPTRRQEAMAIALRLRGAAEAGQTAALITPDRMLTRQVSAALDRWNIIPDDSAGMPLPLAPTGRLLRHVAGLMGTQLTAEALLALLKHPLVHRGTDRGPHLIRTRELELHIRQKGIPFPDRAQLSAWAVSRRTDPGTAAWIEWMFDAIEPCLSRTEAPLGWYVSQQIETTERLAQGAQGHGSGELWSGSAGEEALRITDELLAEAMHGGSLSAHDYVSLFTSILNKGEVRDTETPHPNVLIWGTMEARMSGADLLILAGLNEGSWPEPPAPDPWLNRDMRHRAGLLLPERRIGLSAHDFQQAVAGREVWLTRSIRSDEAETVPSRWLSRMTNLLDGLPKQDGPQRLAEMRARGDLWLRRVGILEEPGVTPRAVRPSPRPPVSLRPRKLSVTEIPRLIRDPYAIYARHVLRLRRLDPITQEPDAPLRGTVIHEILDRFMRDVISDPGALTEDHLLRTTDLVLREHAPWPAMRALWRARITRFSSWLIARETERRETSEPLRTEVPGRLLLTTPAFELTAKADRIDRDTQGRLIVLDYKTGKPKSEKQQLEFEKQLLLEAAMAENGAFADISPARVAQAIYIGLTAKPSEVPAPLDKEPPAQSLEGLRTLIAAYLDPAKGFTARRAMERDAFLSDYDTLSRFGEWDETQDPEPEDLI